MKSLSEDDARFAREHLADGCDLMERMLVGLLDSKGRIAEEIHALRKLGKSLRGGFALFRLGKSSTKEIQAVGRLLSGPRDAVSRLSTWNKLKWKGDERTVAAIVGLLDQQTHSAARKPPRETIAWCVDRVVAARKELQALPVENLAERLDAGIKKLGTQVVKRCKRLDHRGEEEFHDARKAIKAYLGALGFLPKVSVTLHPIMTELPEILGDENDLATLSGWLDEHGFTAHFAPDLWKTLEHDRSKLREKA
ncbi:MAG TPA: CHAD domain-containing protein, partial [Luteolibacter sp.]